MAKTLAMGTIGEAFSIYDEVFCLSGIGAQNTPETVAVTYTVFANP